jgi:hypothetical protein
MDKMNKKKDKIRKDMLLYNKIALEIKILIIQELNEQNKLLEKKISIVYKKKITTSIEEDILFKLKPEKY